MSSSEFSALRQIINTSLDSFEAELSKLNLAPPGLFENTRHPIDDPSFLPCPELYDARENLVAALGMMTALVQSPYRRLWMLSLQHHTSTSLQLVTRTEIPDIIFRAGPEGISCSEIAIRVGIPEPKLMKVLRLLANQHIFRETTEGVFTHTRASLPLISGNHAHDYIRYKGWISIMSAPHVVDVLLDPKRGPSQRPTDSPLGVAAQLEEKGFVGYHDWLSKLHPETLQGYNRAIAGHGSFTILGILADFPWEEIVKGKTIVDIGGGNGAMLLALLEKFPNCRGVVQDLAPTAQQAKENFLENLPQAVLDDRAKFETHDFFKPQPYQGPEYIYILRHIIHNWSDEYSVKILEQLAKGMSSDSRIFVIEQVVRPTILDPRSKEQDGQSVGPQIPYPLPISLGVARQVEYVLDFEMMSAMNALDRTRAQFEAVFKAAGLRIVKVWDTRGPDSVLEVALLEKL